MSRKRRRVRSLPQVPAAEIPDRRHPLHKIRESCREVGEGLLFLVEDCWKNEIRQPNMFVGFFRLLWTAITAPWTDHSTITISSEPSDSSEKQRQKRLVRKK